MQKCELVGERGSKVRAGLHGAGNFSVAHMNDSYCTRITVPPLELVEILFRKAESLTKNSGREEIRSFFSPNFD